MDNTVKVFIAAVSIEDTFVSYLNSKFIPIVIRDCVTL